MMRLEPMADSDFHWIVEWNEGKPREFVVQWGGPKFPYPFTAESLAQEFLGHNEPGSDNHLYKILLDGQTVGMVVLFHFVPEELSAVVGNFLIGDERERGRGLGEQALRLTVKKGFQEFGLDKVLLNVFDFNTDAIRCYEKVGFRQVDFKPNVYETERGPWGLIRMMITPDALEQSETLNQEACACKTR